MAWWLAFTSIIVFVFTVVLSFLDPSLDYRVGIGIAVFMIFFAGAMHVANRMESSD